MQETSYIGVVKGRQIALEKKAKLPTGTRVLVTPIEDVRGTGPAVVAAARAAPHLNPKDVKDFMRVIQKGKRLVQFGSPFARRRRQGRK